MYLSTALITERETREQRAESTPSYLADKEQTANTRCAHEMQKLQFRSARSMPETT